MTNEEAQRAEAWAKMTPKQRMSFIKQGAHLNTTSSQRMAEVAQLKRRAGGA